MVGRMLAGCASSEYKEAIWQLSANCRWRLWTSFFHPYSLCLSIGSYNHKANGNVKCRNPKRSTRSTRTLTAARPKPIAKVGQITKS